MIRDMPLPAVVLGAPVDPLTMDSCLARIGDLVEHGRRTGRVHQIATINVDFLANAVDDPDLLSIFQNSSLALADGMPVVWTAKMLGTPLPERVAGADLVPRIAVESRERGWKILYFGGIGDVARRAVDKIRSEHPDVDVVAQEAPMIPDVDDVPAEVLEQIAQHDADIVCVGLGNPKQERFIRAHGAACGSPVMIGVGGSFDMMVGDRRRAPRWVQRTGTEWIFRAFQEPTRLGPRYADDVKIAGPALWRYVRHARSCRGASTLTVVVDAQSVHVRPGPFDASEWGTTLAGLDVDPSPRSVSIDLEGVDALAPESHAALVALVRGSRCSSRPLRCSGRSAALDRCLDGYDTGVWLRSQWAPSCGGASA